MSEEKSVVWTRLGGISSREPILIGRKISPQWLQERVPLVEFRFTGDLFSQFSNLLSIAKAERKNLPIVSLPECDGRRDGQYPSGHRRSR